MRDACLGGAERVRGRRAWSLFCWTDCGVSPPRCLSPSLAIEEEGYRIRASTIIAKVTRPDYRQSAHMIMVEAHINPQIVDPTSLVRHARRNGQAG